jgi:hypothetical protein
MRICPADINLVSNDLTYVCKQIFWMTPPSPKAIWENSVALMPKFLTCLISNKTATE